MLRYLSLRVLYTLPAVWLVVSIVFLLIHLVPGDPILQMLGEGAPAADVEATRHLYGLDRPLGEQYLHYWKGVLRGDLGPSLRFNQSVSKMIAQRYPYTLELTLASLLVAIVLSIPAGVRSAQRRNQWDDPDYYGARAAIRRAARGRDRDRENLFLARNRAFDHRRHRQPRLLPCTGLHIGDRTNLHRGKFLDGLAVFGGESENQAVRMM